MDDTRELLKRIRGKGTYPQLKNKTNETIKPKELSLRDMLKITRKQNLFEDLNTDEKTVNKITTFDQTTEEEKFKNAFDDLNVSVTFIPLEVYENYVFWGGTIDGIIQFVFKVTPDENTSGIELNYLQDFKPNIDSDAANDAANEESEDEQLVNRLKSYYEEFSKYWRSELINK